MLDDLTFALIHSPLVGPSTWELVAGELEQRGLKTAVPALAEDEVSPLPLWQQHAKSAAAALQIPFAGKIVWVAHSGAGPLLPAIRQAMGRPVAAYLFVDAGIPRDGLSRLELMRLEDAAWAAQFHEALQRGERFPNWSADDLRDVIPDDALRHRLVDELRPRGLSFFNEPLPVFAEWPDAPCAYIKFSRPYTVHAQRAQAAGWLVHELPAGHFHMLVNPPEVAEMIVHCVRQLGL